METVSVDPTIFDGCSNVGLYAPAFAHAIRMLQSEMSDHPEKFGASDYCCLYEAYSGFAVDGKVVLPSIFTYTIRGDDGERWEFARRFLLTCNEEKPLLKMMNFIKEFISNLDLDTLKSGAAQDFREQVESSGKSIKALPEDIRQFYGLA